MRARQKLGSRVRLCLGGHSGSKYFWGMAVHVLVGVVVSWCMTTTIRDEVGASGDLSPDIPIGSDGTDDSFQ